MSVREQKMAETRKKLIKVARRTFAEYGYADTSMDKLTAEAGLTRGALYHHFGDKKACLLQWSTRSIRKWLHLPSSIWSSLLICGKD